MVPLLSRTNLVWSMVLVVAALVSVTCFRSRGAQSSTWTVPYLSGAANSSWGKGWRVERASLAHFNALSTDGQWQYRAPRVADEELMSVPAVNAPGFVHVVVVARTLFPWLGDLQAIVMLHCLVHLVICWHIVCRLHTGLQRGLFIALYAANPIVIYCATFPYYYFWQVIVPACLIYCLFRAWKVPTWQALVMVLAACSSVWIRPSTLFLAMGFVGFLAWKSDWARGGILLLVFVAGIAKVSGDVPGTPGMPMFVGLGAYGEPDGIYFKDRLLSDTAGYDFYERQTGEKVVSSTPDGFEGNWYEPQFRKRFNRVLMQGVREYAVRHPGLVARNAVLNMLQGFSVGYKTNVSDLVRYAVAASGLLFIVLMIMTRQWILLVANGLAIGSFALYFPPIPAYMFGSYLLLAMAATVIGDSWYESKRKHAGHLNGPCAYE